MVRAVAVRPIRENRSQEMEISDGDGDRVKSQASSQKSEPESGIKSRVRAGVSSQGWDVEAGIQQGRRAGTKNETGLRSQARRQGPM